MRHPEGDFACGPVKFQNSGIPVFSQADLSKPAFTLATGGKSFAVGFDLKSERLYALSSESEYVVFDSKGTKLKGYRLDDKTQRIDARQFLVHPDGRKVLMLGELVTGRVNSRVWSIELPAK